MKYIYLFIALFFSSISYSQTFTAAGGGIPDNQQPVSFPLIVSGVTNTALDTTFGIESVCINVNHPYVSDLQIWLIAPDNTFIELTSDNGGSGNNYSATCFSDLATNPINQGNPPFFGNFKPESPLYAAHNGQNPNGIWSLYVIDTFTSDSGFVIGFNITFGTNIGQPFSFPSSNLPIIKINTFGQAIPDEPKITARMQIIDNGTGIRNFINDTVFSYDGFIGIEVRGSSSQMFPKKSFSVETRDSLGNDLDTSLLGMPSESDWVLNANYTDKTFLRNALSYHIANEMGNYASRTKYCEVFLNGIYQGLYVFMEKIKRDDERVDISKLTVNDTNSVDVTGGYILKVDKLTGNGTGGFYSNYQGINGGPIPFILYDYPDDVTIVPAQQTYIQAYMDSFEVALHGPQFTSPTIGYKHFINDTSFIDFFLANELSKNVDGYRISSYLYKKKITKGNLLYAGPVWDFDIAWGNADYLNAQFTTGWSYTFNSPGADNQVPFWWSRLLADPAYTGKLQCRYDQFRSTFLSTANVHAYIDSMANYLQESQNRNFQVWPILGVYVWPNPTPIPATYADEITNLKTWIANRFTWLDLSMPGTCTIAGLEEAKSINGISIYPNPTSDILHITSDLNLINSIKIFDINGRCLNSFLSLEQFRFSFETSQLSSGIYFVEIQCENQFATMKVVKN